jgi:hypothetical protein
VNEYVCRDVFGFSLRYYAGDYTAVGRHGTTAHFDMAEASGVYGSRSLYNGNISGMVTAISKFMEGSVGPLGKSYEYDQLNRLVGSRTVFGANKAGNTWSGGVGGL